ncbi:ESPR-type extended signal peptide-containing protein, partial [Burkholderia vietnamiensis]|uniref:ESPR-type extended signal peptide-containing protein n=3 Tax=Burkholderia vietnamiensis TaxID=60552 RepID=UPI0022AB3858
MNKVYRTIWNKALGAFVATSENDKSHGKGRSGESTRVQDARLGGASSAVGYEASYGTFEIGGARHNQFLGKRAIAMPFALMLGSFGLMSSANAQLFVNNGTDPTCALIFDGSAVTYQSQVTQSECNANLSTQTTHSTFYGTHLNGSPPWASNLSLGGSLYVNGGQIGLADISGGTFSMRIGSTATMNGLAGLDSIAIGSAQTAISDGAATAATVASGAWSIALGTATQAVGAASVAIGPRAVAINANDVALGASSITAVPNPTAGTTIGGIPYAFAGAGPTSVVSVGAPGMERQITNVAAGRVSAASTDAINGSQLFATNSAIENLSTTFSTSTSAVASLSTSTSTTASWLSTGMSSLSTGLSTTNSNVASVSTGLSSLSTGLSTVNSNVASLSSGVSTLSSEAVKYDKNVDGTVNYNSVTLNPGGTSAQIHNVGAGTAGTDAVNVSQLSTVVSTSKTRYYSVNDNGVQQGNYGNDGASGLNAMAAGTNAIAAGASSVALGNGASGTGAQSIAIGNASTATSFGGVAVGSGATASHANDIALGTNSATAIANPTSGTTIGGTAYSFAGATPTSVVSVGSLGNERQITNVAAGQLSVTSTDAVNGSQLYATNQAIGSMSTSVSTGISSLATGLSTTNSNVVSLSTSASTTASSLSTGVSSLSTGLSTLSNEAVKYDKNPDGTVNYNSVTLNPGGTSTQIHNVAAGTAGTDAVNVSQLSTVVSTSKTHYYSVNDNGVQQGNYANDGATGVGALAAGINSVGSGANSVAVGAGATASSDGAVAVGNSAVATGGKAVSIGVGNTASGDGAVAIGDPNVAIGAGAIALGVNGTANGSGAVALGFQNTANGNGSVALGNTSTAAQAGAVALGQGAVATNTNDVALGSGSVTGVANPVSSATIAGQSYAVAGTAPTSVVSVGAPGAERQITNVAAGQLSATSTDAVNGSQLFATDQAVGSLSTSTSTGISSLSTGLSTTNSTVASLSTGTSTLTSGIASLSTSTSTTASSLST